MAIEKVQITVSTIKELLDNGLTWLKKDDLGYGSIQEKFQAGDTHIAAIRKHPLLKDLDTTAKVFVIIDDTKNNQKNETTTSITASISDNQRDDRLVANLSGFKDSELIYKELLSTASNEIFNSNASGGDRETSSVDAFANL